MSAAGEGETIEAFLARHWSRPLPAQGEPPGHYSALEASLAPDDCAACHNDQFDDWRGSRHAQAMGPGIVGQLAEMAPQARDDHQSCLRCHAPLAEQAESLAASLAEGAVGVDATGERSRPLHSQGVVCAACHVRSHQRYGPPRRDGSGPSGKLPHDGWRVSRAFADAQFCAPCHQFPAEGFALNGKLIENTFEEWRASPYAEQGVTCQACHMPERRHLWRGVHDPDMMRAALAVDVERVARHDGRLKARIRLTNRGAGHYLPTYVTPRLHVEAVQVDDVGAELAGSLRRYTIAREITLDLSAELFDTRLEPLETRTVDYDADVGAAAAGLLVRVRVEPDAFYERFFTALLESGRSKRGRALIERALDAARGSHFVIHARRYCALPVERERPPPP